MLITNKYRSSKKVTTEWNLHDEFAICRSNRIR